MLHIWGLLMFMVNIRSNPTVDQICHGDLTMDLPKKSDQGPSVSSDGRLYSLILRGPHHHNFMLPKEKINK